MSYLVQVAVAKKFIEESWNDFSIIKSEMNCIRY